MQTRQLHWNWVNSIRFT